MEKETGKKNKKRPFRLLFTNKYVYLCQYINQ
jgi:hypothetical protein